MKRLFLRLAVGLQATANRRAPAHAQAEVPDAVPGEVLVGFTQTAGAAQVKNALAAVGENAGQDPVLRCVRVRLKPGVPMDAARARLARHLGPRGCGARGGDGGRQRHHGQADDRQLRAGRHPDPRPGVAVSPV